MEHKEIFVSSFFFLQSKKKRIPEIERKNLTATVSMDQSIGAIIFFYHVNQVIEPYHLLEIAIKATGEILHSVNISGTGVLFKSSHSGRKHVIEITVIVNLVRQSYGAIIEAFEESCENSNTESFI